MTGPEWNWSQKLIKGFETGVLGTRVWGRGSGSRVCFISYSNVQTDITLSFLGIA
jgi:hypothetical protein